MQRACEGAGRRATVPRATPAPMVHPFEAWSDELRRRWLLGSSIGTAIVFAPMAWIDSQLRTEASPLGIVSFELAGTALAAQRILDAWSEAPRAAMLVAFQTGLDYLFLVAYGLVLSLACARATARIRPVSSGLASVGTLVTYLQAAAPVCDAVENGALFAMLLRYGTDPQAQVASAFALAKFGFIAMGLSFLALAPLVQRLAKRGGG